jgi:hypothetical protein
LVGGQIDTKKPVTVEKGVWLHAQTNAEGKTDRVSATYLPLAVDTSHDAPRRVSDGSDSKTAGTCGDKHRHQKAGYKYAGDTRKDIYLPTMLELKILPRVKSNRRSKKTPDFAQRLPHPS